MGVGHPKKQRGLEGTMKKRDWYCEDVLSEKIDVNKIWEDDRVLVFHHPTPLSECHAVAIPKQHVSSILDPMATDGALLTSMVIGVQKAAVEMGIDQTGFFVETNAIDPGVTPHMHWHIRNK